MWFERRKVLPKVPTNRKEALIALEGIQPRDGVIIKSDFDNEIGVIINTASFDFMKDEGLFFADGTFKSSPDQFYQIYTFIGHRKGHYIPMMFLLLPGASKAIYETAFQLFKDTFRSQTGSEFLERTLFLDFERAALEGAKSSLPGTALKCCLFHLKQNWYRKIQECGLSVDYNDEDSSFRQILKMTFGLPFLDFLDIYDSFAFDFYLEAPEDDRLQKFYDYLLKTYIKSHSLFPPTLWASVTVSEKRTTNGCESFHKQLNGLFYRSHPVIFELVGRLQEVVFENSFKLKGSTKKIKASDLKKYRWEEETMAMFDAGDISRKKFLQRICCSNLPATNIL